MASDKTVASGHFSINKSDLSANDWRLTDVKQLETQGSSLDIN